MARCILCGTGLVPDARRCRRCRAYLCDQCTTFFGNECSECQDRRTDENRERTWEENQCCDPPTSTQRSASRQSVS